MVYSLILDLLYIQKKFCAVGTLFFMVSDSLLAINKFMQPVPMADDDRPFVF